MRPRERFTGNRMSIYSDGLDNHLVFKWNSENVMSGRSGRYRLDDLKKCDCDSCIFPKLPKGWRISRTEQILVMKKMQEFKSKRILRKINESSVDQVGAGVSDK